MEQKKSEFNKVLNAWDVLVIAFGAMIGWGWVVSTGGWIEKGGVLGAAIGFEIWLFVVGNGTRAVDRLYDLCNHGSRLFHRA